MKKIIILLFVLVFLISCQATEPEIKVKKDVSGNGEDNADKDTKGQDIEDNDDSGSSDDIVVKKNDGSEVKEDLGFAGITKTQCEEADGYWNECGSPCAGTDSDFCIEVCQVQCECGGFAGFACPKDFKCRLSGNIADEMGVCVEG